MAHTRLQNQKIDLAEVDMSDFRASHITEKAKNVPLTAYTLEAFSTPNDARHDLRPGALTAEQQDPTYTGPIEGPIYREGATGEIGDLSRLTRTELFNMAQMYLDETRAQVASDNPYRLTASEISDWKAYRSAWYTIRGTNGTDGDISAGAPSLPEEWILTTRYVGQSVQLVLCRKSILDTYDLSYREIVFTL